MLQRRNFLMNAIFATSGIALLPKKLFAKTKAFNLLSKDELVDEMLEASGSLGWVSHLKENVFNELQNFYPESYKQGRGWESKAFWESKKQISKAAMANVAAANIAPIKEATAKTFSRDELLEITEFFSSPSGQKFLANTEFKKSLADAGSDFYLQALNILDT